MNKWQPSGLAKLRDQIVEALSGHTNESRDCQLTGDYLADQVWPLVVAALVEVKRALEPFAKIAADYEHADRQRRPTADENRTSIALGDCRRAREALASLASNKSAER